MYVLLDKYLLNKTRLKDPIVCKQIRVYVLFLSEISLFISLLFIFSDLIFYNVKMKFLKVDLYQ